MAQDKVTIRQFGPEEWPVFKEARLKALQSDPEFFGSNYEREAAYTDEDWRETVDNPDGAVFGIFHGSSLIGVTGIYINPQDPATAWLWADWMEKKWRRKGHFIKAYEARIAWAKARTGLKRVAVSHRKSDIVSAKLHQKCGFVFTHAEARVWSDGKHEPHHFFELRL